MLSGLRQNCPRFRKRAFDYARVAFSKDCYPHVYRINLQVYRGWLTIRHLNRVNAKRAEIIFHYTMYITSITSECMLSLLLCAWSLLSVTLHTFQHATQYAEFQCLRGLFVGIFLVFIEDAEILTKGFTPIQRQSVCHVQSQRILNSSDGVMTYASDVRYLLGICKSFSLWCAMAYRDANELQFSLTPFTRSDE